MSTRSFSSVSWMAALVISAAGSLGGCTRAADASEGFFGSGITAGTAADAGTSGHGTGEPDGESTSEGEPGGGVSGPSDDPSTTGAPGGGGPGGGDPPPPEGSGECCSGNETPGCADPMIEACVCAQDSFCCDNVWDDLCASMVVELGCAPCELPGGGETSGGAETSGGGVATTTGAAGSTTGAGGSTGGMDPGGSTSSTGGDSGAGGADCCMEHDDTGCSDPEIQTCVCNDDSYCCTVQWDDLCASEVVEFGCGVC